MTDIVLEARPTLANPQTGILGRGKLACNLGGLMADTMLLAVKTQAVHWNAVGPLFVGLHDLTGVQYRNMFDAIDAIAGRIRSLGHPTPASVTEMLPLTVVEELAGEKPAEEMIESLAEDHEKISTRLRDIVGVAEDQRDAATVCLLTERLQFHEQAVWMLRAILSC